MSLKKTATEDLGLAETWGSLIPIATAQKLQTFNLTKDEISIGRNPDCIILINDKRLSGKHCSITREGKKVTLTDFSTNGTFIGNKKVGKGNSVELHHKDQIWLLTASKVDISETIGFNIEIEEEKKVLDVKLKQQEEKKQQTRKKEEAQKSKLQAENAASSKLVQSIKDQITCPFCYQIMSIPVAIQPCNHRFCGGCLTQLVNSKKDTCITCRKQITTGVRDAAFTSIIDDYLKGHPDQKRDPKQEEDLKNKNIFGFDPININQRIHGKKIQKKKAEKIVDAPVRARGRGRRLARGTSDLSASDQDEKDKCRQCLVARNGFQCTATQVHVPCHTCAKLIPQRDDPKLCQSCAICSTYYCNLYYPPCKAGSKLTKLEDKRDSCKIDTELLRGNKYQFEYIRNFLLQKKQNSKDVFDHMLDSIKKGKFSYLIDRKIMKVAPIGSRQVKLTVDSAICDLCWHDLWFQMVFAYRSQISGQLPAAVRDRPICYWGINCRTMDHNDDHAKKYSHCIYQTKF